MLFARFYLTALTCLALVGCSNPGKDCMSRVKPDLKDPETASLVSYEDVYIAGIGTKVTIRATNSFGAYGRVYGFCNAKMHKVSSDPDGYIKSDGWTIDAK